MMDLAVGALLGLAYIAAPGPVNVETLRRGLAGGPRAAFAVQLGACLGHVAYAALAMLGLGILAGAAPVHLLLGLAGTGLLVYLGASAVRDGWRGRVPRGALLRPNDSRGTPLARYGSPPYTGDRFCGGPLWRHTLMVGAAIALANPFAMAFWLAVGESVLHQAHRNGVLFLGGFFLSVLLWAISVPGLVGWGHAALRGRMYHGVSMVCGVALIMCGLVLGQALVAPAP